MIVFFAIKDGNCRIATSKNEIARFIGANQNYLSRALRSAKNDVITVKGATVGQGKLIKIYGRGAGLRRGNR